MIELKVEQDEMAVLSGETTPNTPNYCSQLLHLANQDLNDSVPQVLSRIRNLERHVNSDRRIDWSGLDKPKMNSSEEDAVKQMMDMLNQLKESLETIDEQTVKHFVHDQLVSDTFLGEKVIESILMKVAVSHNTFYEVAEKEDFDGYIGTTPVVIKPFRDHLEKDHNDSDDIGHIYYQQDGSALRLLVDF